jgi:sugar fermentation stimulation protein A
MQYQNVCEGRFIDRPNRFIARVEREGEILICHVKNTGRCRELLVPGCRVYLEKSGNPARKTAYDLIAVQKGEKLINMDAQAPNRVFAEWAGTFAPDLIRLQPEVVYGQSRLDFMLQRPDGKHFVEVKGVTLESGGHVFFPDAPTERGVKHLHELIRAKEEGYRATAFFVVQMAQVQDFAPNEITHPAFGTALREARDTGVEIAAYTCCVTPSSLCIDHSIPVIL